jgi:hypothetical protein
MHYTHQGKVVDNGIVIPGPVLTDMNEFIFHPEDDGRQIADYIRGDFEWWYFDINDQASGSFLKIILHVGTDPLRSRVFPQLAVSVNTPEKSENLYYFFSLSEVRADKQCCNISIRDKIKIRAENNEHPSYFIEIDIPGFECSFRFKGEIEGWKPYGNKIVYQKGKRKGDFSWVIPMPGARVEGEFYYENRKYVMTGAIGYHDHNCIKPHRENPLYIDDLANKWYWGKFHAGIFTVIFADVYSRANRTRSLMVAENNKIIHSSNNLIDISVLSSGYDNILKAAYPESISIKSLDDQFPLQAEIGSCRILDRKDLLDGVNPVIKFLIKRLVARPVYHGIFAKARLKINNNNLQGSGNFESMVFRGRNIS